MNVIIKIYGGNFMNNNTRFVDSDSAFLNCFNTDEERSQYMYMYSQGDVHYFKNIDTRDYVMKTIEGLI
jgi:hypothetical protein